MAPCKKTENMSELLARVRLKNEIERGKILEAKAKAEISKLASKEEAKKATFAKARIVIVRDRILDIPDRIAEKLASIDEASQIREILQRELRHALQDLSRDLDDGNTSLSFSWINKREAPD